MIGPVYEDMYTSLAAHANKIWIIMIIKWARSTKDQIMKILMKFDRLIQTLSSSSHNLDIGLVQVKKFSWSFNNIYFIEKRNFSLNGQKFHFLLMRDFLWEDTGVENISGL